MSAPHPNRLAFRVALYEAAKSSGMDAAYPAQTNNYVRFGRVADNSDIGVSVTRTGSRVTLNNRGPGAKAVFVYLRERREVVDATIGHDLDWEDEDPDRQKTVVRASVSGGYLSNRGAWAAQHQKILELVKVFRLAFHKHI